jgi:hypothetical protein
MLLAFLFSMTMEALISWLRVSGVEGPDMDHEDNVVSTLSMIHGHRYFFILCRYITVPKCKLASGTPPKGSPED